MEKKTKNLQGRWGRSSDMPLSCVHCICVLFCLARRRSSYVSHWFIILYFKKKRGPGLRLSNGILKDWKFSFSCPCRLSLSGLGGVPSTDLSGTSHVDLPYQGWSAYTWPLEEQQTSVLSCFILGPWDNSETHLQRRGSSGTIAVSQDWGGFDGDGLPVMRGFGPQTPHAICLLCAPSPGKVWVSNSYLVRWDLFLQIPTPSRCRKLNSQSPSEFETRTDSRVQTSQQRTKGLNLGPQIRTWDAELLYYQNLLEGLHSCFQEDESVWGPTSSNAWRLFFLKPPSVLWGEKKIWLEPSDGPMCLNPWVPGK